MKYIYALCAIAILPHFVITSSEAETTYNYDTRRYIGSIDGRASYNSDAVHETIKWDTPIYNTVVHISYNNNKNIGTGTLISPKHILTNKHVAQCCGIKHNPPCKVTLHNQEQFDATLVATSTAKKDEPAMRDETTEEYLKDDALLRSCSFDPEMIADGQDWAIIELKDAEIKSYAQYDTTSLGNIDFRAGFASLRVLSDDDITNIREAYTEAFANQRGTFVELKEYDENTDAKKRFENFKEIYAGKVGSPFLQDCLNDTNNLKITTGCDLVEKKDNYDGDKRTETTCTGWAGDSGSALIRNNKIVCLHNSGNRALVTKTDNPNYSKINTIHRFCIPTDYIFSQSVTNMLNNAINNAQGTNPATSQPIYNSSKNTSETKSDATFMTANARKQQVKKTGIVAAVATLATGAAVTAGAIAATNSNTEKQSITHDINDTPSHARIVGETCSIQDTPKFARKGIYTTVSIKGYPCNDNKNCACIATECHNGYYLVHKQINGKWESMGYCIQPRSCNTGTLDIDTINGINIIRQHGNIFCKN